MKYYAIIAAAAMLLSSCGPNKEEAAKVQAQRDSLISIITQRDSSINDFLATNSEVERNLDSIVVRERAINKSMENKAELNATGKERINADIAAINTMMKENRQKINELNRKLKKSNGQNAEYKKMIEMLNERLAAKDKELADLNNQLAALKTKVEQLETSNTALTAENAEKTQTIEKQTGELHTAYYIVGKSKELRDKKIIDKMGGLLGIGRTETMQPDAGNSGFTQIDITKVSEIPVNSKRAKFVTSHPTDAYTLSKDSVTKIVTIKITNATKFWSTSKYLVVVND